MQMTYRDGRSAEDGWFDLSLSDRRKAAASALRMHPDDVDGCISLLDDMLGVRQCDGIERFYRRVHQMMGGVWEMLTRRASIVGLLALPLAPRLSWAQPALVEKDGLPTSVCQTGDAYESLTSSGVKPEGKPFSKYYSTPQEAWGAYAAQLARYKQGRSGTLYWRKRPCCDDVGYVWTYISTGKDTWDVVAKRLPGLQFVVYSRLVISDGPEVYPDLIAYAKDRDPQSYDRRIEMEL